MNPQKVYRCLKNNPEHESLKQARDCCSSEEKLWECAECGCVYDDESQAVECCMEDE